MNDNQWEQSLAATAYAEGRHIPASWNVEYDDAADGCMPTGWYAIGLDANGRSIVWPVRHEYGPFGTEAEAITFAATFSAH